jgi:hypothetical protein
VAVPEGDEFNSRWQRHWKGKPNNVSTLKGRIQFNAYASHPHPTPPKGRGEMRENKSN